MAWQCGDGRDAQRCSVRDLGSCSRAVDADLLELRFYLTQSLCDLRGLFGVLSSGGGGGGGFAHRQFDQTLLELGLDRQRERERETRC
jgi:hypothetical protein